MDLSKLFMGEDNKQAFVFSGKDKEKYLDWIGKILDTPTGPAKWREIANLLCAVNPEAKQQFVWAAEEAKKINADLLNKVGASKSGDMRHLARIPACLLDALFVLDPELKYNLDSRDRKFQQGLMRKVVETFKGFQVPDKI